MSEVCHHASIRALSHVQGLNFSPQDIETSIPTKDRRFTKNKFTANVKAQRGFWNLDVNEKNLPFDLRSLPIFKGEKKTQQTWSQGGIRHLSLMLMKTTKGLKEKTYLSMDTSTFMEWFSSGNFTRSLKWLSQVQNVRAWEIWRWWRQKCKKKTGNQECSQGHSMEEDEMALQECNKLSDLLALFHNWFFVYMVEIKANKTTLYTSLFL